MALFNARPRKPPDNRSCQKCGSLLTPQGFCREENHGFCVYSRHRQTCEVAQSEPNWTHRPLPTVCLCHLFKRGETGTEKPGGLLTREERLLLIEEVYLRLLQDIETFEPIGTELAYLFGAMARQGFCEFPTRGETAAQLRRSFHEKHPVWQFIQLSED